MTTSDDARRLVSLVASRDADELADAFYRGLQADPSAQALVAHDVVEARLRPALQRWIAGLLTQWDEAGIAEQLAIQRRVGAVHARSGVPAGLVARGARLLKQRLAVLLAREQPDAGVHREALVAGTTLIDLAVEHLLAEYMDLFERATRRDEDYRFYSVGTNLSLERERQRTALLDWEKRLLHDVMFDGQVGADSLLAHSSFGLWMRHKAQTLLPVDNDFAMLEESVRRVDDVLAPLRGQAARGDDLRQSLTRATAEAGVVRQLLDGAFERLIDAEAGRDALTQLMNRRYLPSVLSREIELCRRGEAPFAVMIVDVDRFKSINDEHGHDMGDHVLQHLAGVLAASAGAADHVFRYGGEEFVVVAVEKGGVEAMAAAERIRGAVAERPVAVAHGGQVAVTVSVGVATYDGHPDYQRLLDRADRALYRAKALGRNRCVESADDVHPQGAGV